MNVNRWIRGFTVIERKKNADRESVGLEPFSLVIRKVHRPRWFEHVECKDDKGAVVDEKTVKDRLGSVL